MTKEELVEMINSTINTNGSGAITGEALNLALQAIVETMGTGSGSGAERLWGTLNISSEVTFNVTDEEKALNAELYTKWSAMIANDENVVALLKCISSENGATMLSQSVMCSNTGGRIMLYFIVGEFVPITLSSDGSVAVNFGG